MQWAFSGGSRSCKVKLVRAAFHRVPIWLTALVIFGTGAVNAATILPTNSVWKYFTGLSEASAPNPIVWRDVNFDDSTWPSGPAPFYNGESLSGTLIPGMQN